LLRSAKLCTATLQGKAAADEFQKVINHSGIVWNCWTGAMAKLGVARANALQAKTLQGTMPMPHAYAPWPLIKISSRYGKTQIPTSRSSNKPKRNTRNCSERRAKA
jgi:hypothetical protein